MEFGYGAHRDSGPYSSGPGIVGFRSLDECEDTATGWLRGGKKWDKKSRRYVEREDGRETIAVWTGERDEKNTHVIRWTKIALLHGDKTGKEITISREEYQA